MFSKKIYVAAVHVLVWLLLLSLIIAFTSVSVSNEVSFDKTFSFSFFVFAVLYVFLFYFNSHVLIPQLYLQKKYLLYFLVLVFLLVVYNYLKPFDHLMHANHRPEPADMQPPPPADGMRRPPPNTSRQAVDIVSVMLFIMIWAISTVFQIFEQWRKTQQRAVRAEADKANAELSFLKAQINPHFLFNTLNNIYALAVTNSEQTPDAIMRLSNIMRYVTDEATEDFVPLKSEAECITNYIDLQRLRLNKKVEIDFSITGDVTGKRIAPLIFMTFVENVFKYGISSHEHSAITIKLAVEDTLIRFLCRNKLFADSEKVERKGIGIENTKQRLQFLYPGKHLLVISEENELFTADLVLQL